MERRGSDGLIARLDRFYIISSAGIACGFTVFMTPFLLFVQFFLAPEAVRAQPLWTQVLNVTGVILYLPVFVFLALMSYRSFLSFLRPTAWYTRFPILAALVALWTYFGPAIQKVLGSDLQLLQHHGSSRRRRTISGRSGTGGSSSSGSTLQASSTGAGRCSHRRRGRGRPARTFGRHTGG